MNAHAALFLTTNRNALCMQLVHYKPSVTNQHLSGKTLVIALIFHVYFLIIKLADSQRPLVSFIWPRAVFSR